MADQSTESKPKAEAEIGAEEARKTLTDLLGRAGFADERIVVTRNGKPWAALVGLRDLERLRSTDAA